jgi:hypothetical protein
MLNRYGDEAVAESANRAEELAADGGLAARHRRNQAARDHDSARAGTLEGRRLPVRTRGSLDAARSSVEFLECQIRGEEPAIIELCASTSAI